MKRLRDSLRGLMRPQLDALPEGWLFACSGQPALIVEEATETIVEANPAATELLGVLRKELLGTPLHAAFAPDSGPRLREALATAAGRGLCADARAMLRGGRRELRLSLSLVRRAGVRFLLVHIAAGARAASAPGADPAGAFGVLEDLAEGFVVTDLALRIEYANATFIRWIGAESAQSVGGAPLARWLALEAADLARLEAVCSQREAVATLRAALTAAGQPGRLLEVWAVPVPDGPLPCWGFRLREVGSASALEPVAAD
ncbi:MAG: PAS domain-containing protein [Proteobacteria bacterium]|nr:PAS domain-containing protein [Pseudomonadota bacterium]